MALNAQDSSGTSLDSYFIEEIDSVEYINRGVVLIEEDTLFSLYDHIYGYQPKVRAQHITERIDKIINSRDFEADSFRLAILTPYYQIYYQDEFVMNIGERDALGMALLPNKAADKCLEVLKKQCEISSSSLNLKNLLIQIAMAVLAIIISGLVIRYVNRFFKYISKRITGFKGVYLVGIKFRNYEFINEERLTNIVLLANNIIRIAFLIFLLYLTLPVIFSIFPWTEGISTMLISYIMEPVKSTIGGIISFLPDLFKILVIFFVTRYAIKGVRFLASEVENGKLNIPNFYPDWAMPTARIIMFFLYTFMFVMIFPLLPGSDSTAFKGVSVFLGLIVSLGSSTSIANIMAGLVITYMRPFRIGDRVKVGDVSGDIVEKNLLVTRVKTIKNEIVTMPNSMVLTQTSTNYTLSNEMAEGLIIHTTITIGYDVPWRQVHAMLIDSACKTPFVEQNPKPFVLQTSLDDFYISYQLNAYTKEASRQAGIYSDLHAIIQDVFAKNDVEIMSPHYQADRKGPSTIPSKENQ